MAVCNDEGLEYLKQEAGKKICGKYLENFCIGKLNMEVVLRNSKILRGSALHNKLNRS